MAVKAITYKNWCVDNISPQCWPRILLKSLEVVRANGFQLNQMEEPDESMELSTELLESLNNSLQQIYEIQIEEGVLK